MLLIWHIFASTILKNPPFYRISNGSLHTDIFVKVTGKKAGKVTITATANKVSTTKDIVVKNGITEFKAATPKKLTVKFAGALESVAKENFTLTDAKGAKVAIQKAALDETKTIVTLDLYSKLTTATAYTVSVKIGDDTYTDSLTFVKGTVAKIVAAKSGVLTTIAEGTAQVKVTSGSVSQVFTITVSAAAKAMSLAVDASSVLKASKTNATVNKASVKVNVLDQNGKDFNNDASSKNLTFTLTSVMVLLLVMALL